VNAGFFAIAATRRTDVVTDLSYSLSFAVLAIALPFVGAHEAVQLIASLLVLIWAVRLGGYLFRRILRIKVDHRFDERDDLDLVAIEQLARQVADRVGTMVGDYAAPLNGPARSRVIQPP